MTKFKTYQQFFLLALAVVICVLSYFIVRPMLTSVLSAIILAYLFYPLYLWWRRILVRLPEKLCSRLAVILTIVVIFLIFLIPLFVCIALLWSKIKEAEFFLSTFLPQILAGNEWVQQLIALPLLRELNIRIDLWQMFGAVWALVFKTLQTIFTQLPVLVLGTIVALFITYYILRNAQSILDFLKEIFPLSNRQYARIRKDFSGLGRGMIVSQLAIGIVQFVLITVACLICGLPNVLMLGTLAFVVGSIPFISAVLVWLGIMIYMFISVGLHWQTVFMFIYGLVLVCNVENFVRPKILSDNVQINPVFMLIGFIGGFLLFGIPGILIGPFILTMFELALEIFKQLE
ncbi:putative PurR-regulated permease PerM [Candidatus Termititenax persephonae]|uniref:PurR-regulated permease PerM n=1 Tax=Candidatus Termititenax persephonae TaxID=2218525 RepID=A0A388THJ8_9BACT|nr:putative PurR-regulated permease PerM [Candidatus Termititenax persephonae]